MINVFSRAVEVMINYVLFPFLYPLQGDIISVCRNEVTATFKTRPWTADKWIVWETWGLGEYTYSHQPIQPHDVVVDIGAQIGAFTVLAAKMASGGQVLAYEPYPPNFSLLQENVRMNNCPNVKLFNQSVGKAGGRNAALYVNPTNSGGHSTVAPVGRRKIRTRQTSLSELIRANKIRRINYLKIDIEGGEFDLLLSTPLRVLQKVDVITLEYHDYLLAKNRHLQIVDWLRAGGFLTRMVRFLPAVHTPGLGNILAVRPASL